MILFYSQDLSGSKAFLAEDEFQHCCKVLRRKTGDEVQLTDGKGSMAVGRIIDLKKNRAVVELLHKTHNEMQAQHLSLAVALPKNRARWEWLLEKAVEIGVDTIIPLITKRTERSKLNVERAAKIMRSAALQSLRTFHPHLAASTSYEKLLSTIPSETEVFMAHYKEENKALMTYQAVKPKGLILIGPEGDFTEEEIELARANEIKLVNISANRLRTETAALVAVDMMKAIGY